MTGVNEFVVLSIVSDDRPGIVRTLSEVLETHKGNWAESNMMSLAGKFAGILQAQLPSDQVASFFTALETLESQGIHVLAHRCSDSSSNEQTSTFNLDLVGQDRSGIVHDISEILSRHNVNVFELNTRCESASMSGETLFYAKADIQVPASSSIEALRKELEDLANELMVDITLEQ